jgi:hypothetical protein
MKFCSEFQSLHTRTSTLLHYQPMTTEKKKENEIGIEHQMYMRKKVRLDFFHVCDSVNKKVISWLMLKGFQLETLLSFNLLFLISLSLSHFSHPQI